ncbi:hypothetical protein BDA96_04G384200 [Sorghum bicolor]|uniref:Uncharacterized protein n=2 Tax=Sorghum bicolor TaxID=4558 RepID=A0A921R9L4_SORBI|nr:hypothetical protein BDA96_04G384200 [Sorghum bicolor]OQU86031.1 hypothetical protein SORBI_3004G358150 [Sorghum bicolor]
MGWTVEGVLRRTQRSKALTYVVPAVQPRMVDAMFQFLRWTCRLYDRVGWDGMGSKSKTWMHDLHSLGISFAGHASISG